MEHEAIRTSIEALLRTVLEAGHAEGCLAEDERGDVIASVGALRSPAALSIDVPLRLGGRLVVCFRDRPAIGLVRTRARRIERELSDLVAAYERSLVRPPRIPGSA